MKNLSVKTLNLLLYKKGTSVALALICFRLIRNIVDPCSTLVCIFFPQRVFITTELFKITCTFHTRTPKFPFEVNLISERLVREKNVQRGFASWNLKLEKLFLQRGLTTHCSAPLNFLVSQSSHYNVHLNKIHIHPSQTFSWELCTGS